MPGNHASTVKYEKQMKRWGRGKNEKWMSKNFNSYHAGVSKIAPLVIPHPKTDSDAHPRTSHPSSRRPQVWAGTGAAGRISRARPLGAEPSKPRPAAAPTPLAGWAASQLPAAGPGVGSGLGGGGVGRLEAAAVRLPVSSFFL